MSFFLIASVLAYFSMRSQKKTELYERTAGIIFLIGLVLMTIIEKFCTFEVL
jgi:hypothetical protein